MKALALIVLSVVSTNLFAQVTPEKIKEVIEYRESGSEPILFDAKLTSEISENNPTDSITSVSKDQKAMFWMKFFIPRNIEDPTIYVVIKKGPVALKTKEITLKTKKNGSYGYRTWVTHKYSKVGNHTIEVYFNDKVIKNMSVAVQ